MGLPHKTCFSHLPSYLPFITYNAALKTSPQTQRFQITITYFCSCVYRQAGSPRFLNLSTTNIVGQIILCHGGCPVHLQDVQQYPWPLPTRCPQCLPLSHDNQKCLQALPNVTWWAKSLSAENHWSRLNLGWAHLGLGLSFWLRPGLFHVSPILLGPGGGYRSTREQAQ